MGRPSRKPKLFYHHFPYRAAPRMKPRRVLAKVEWHEVELFPKVGFVVANISSFPDG